MTPFRLVNRKGDEGYRDDWQRHHLLPRQLEHSENTKSIFERLQKTGFYFDDFDTNGVLLPATVAAATISRLPIHAGPHPYYNHRVEGLAMAAAMESAGIITLFRAIRQLQRCLKVVVQRPRAIFTSIDHITLNPDNAHDHRFADALVGYLDGFAVSSHTGYRRPAP
jgi:hypothetical protein